jgi:hypothetical protein
MNLEIHNIRSTTNTSLFQPSSRLSIYHKGSYYSGIKVYNNLCSKIKNISENIKRFKGARRNLLQKHSFYILNEYLNYKIFNYILTA